MRARFTWSFLLLVALAFPALAQDRRGGPSLDRVLPQIARTVPGTFYDAEGPFLAADGRASYRIKWMTPDGRIIWFNVDARTGQVLGGAQQTNQYRNDDYYNRSRGQYFGDDRDDRGGWDGGRDGNQGRGGADRGANRGGADRGANRGGDHSGDRDGHDRNRGGDRNSGHDWNQGTRGGDRDNNNSRGRDNNRGGDRGNNRGGHDRRHGG